MKGASRRSDSVSLLSARKGRQTNHHRGEPGCKSSNHPCRGGYSNQFVSTDLRGGIPARVRRRMIALRILSIAPGVGAGRAQGRLKKRKSERPQNAANRNETLIGDEVRDTTPMK